MKNLVKAVAVASLSFAALGVTGAFAADDHRDRRGDRDRIEDRRGFDDRDIRRDNRRVDDKRFDDRRFDDRRSSDRRFDDRRRSDRRIRRSRPAFCRFDHDHRSHAANYYSFYKPDRFFRAGPYRSGVSVNLNLDNRRSFDGRSRRAVRGDQIIRKKTFRPRGKARIRLVEREFYNRRGAYRVCTVNAVGPDARFVEYRRLENVARNNCSRRAQIRII